MMARMPELSLSEMSDSEKPSSESISSWVRTRSAPPLAAWMKWPSSTMAAHCAAMASAPAPPSPDAAARRPGSAVAAGGLFGFEREAPLGRQRVLIDLILQRHLINLSHRHCEAAASARLDGLAGAIQVGAED